MKPPRAITVLTHRHRGDTVDAVNRLVDAALGSGVRVHVPQVEEEKHHLGERPGITHGDDVDVDVSVVLGGDGTILTSLRTFAGAGVPTFAFNFGAIGFLATVDDVEEGIARLLAGEFEVASMPALAVQTRDGMRRAAGDISFHRRADGRVAELAYSVESDQLGRVRCDGLVASTAVGSTGYNLANGGPLLAWGVEGYVVSFIAPHSLTARALVMAPDTVLSVQNCSEHEGLDVTTDGRTICPLDPQQALQVRFEPDQILLAQTPGSSFYHRLREKFGRIAV